MLSIIMPIACSGAQLESVVTRLILENRKFILDTPCELILVDSIPNPEHKDSVIRLNNVLHNCNISIRYLETATVGAGAKFREGLEIASGEYILFLVDEMVPLYDFLEDAYVVAQRWDVCSVPYLQASAVEGSTFPLLYPKHAPIAPVSFPLMRRELFMQLAKDMTSHWLGTLHWSLLCAEMGLKVAFSSRHLVYCPLVKIDAVRPSVYQPIGRDVRSRDEQQFKDRWSFDRCEQAHFSMVHMFKSVLPELQDDSHVVVGPKKGLFLVQETGGIPLKNNYMKINSAAEIDRESDWVNEVWRKNVKSDPKVARLFESIKREASSLGVTGLQQKLRKVFKK